MIDSRPAPQPEPREALLRDALAAIETEIALHPYEADAPVSVLAVRDRLRAVLAATSAPDTGAEERPMKCPLCGGPHLSATVHSVEELTAWEGAHPVHVNDGSAERSAMAWSEGYSEGFTDGKADTGAEERPGHVYDHDGTARHHHLYGPTGAPVWWEQAEQFGGERRVHTHALTLGTLPPDEPFNRGRSVFADTGAEERLRAALLRAYEGYPVPHPAVLRLIEDVLGLPRSRAALSGGSTLTYHDADTGAEERLRAALDVDALAEAMWFEGLTNGPTPDRTAAEGLISAYHGMAKHRSALSGGSVDEEAKERA